MLRRIGIIAVLSLIVAALAAVPALAAVSLNHDPTCSLVDAGTITCSGGQVSGLGNSTTQIFYTGQFACETQSGSNRPPGQSRSPIARITPDHGNVKLPTLSLTDQCHGTQTPIAPDEVTLHVVQGGVDNTFPIDVTT
jgi:hypothetical protein